MMAFVSNNFSQFLIFFLWTTICVESQKMNNQQLNQQKLKDYLNLMAAPQQQQQQQPLAMSPDTGYIPGQGNFFEGKNPLSLKVQTAPVQKPLMPGADVSVQPEGPANEKRWNIYGIHNYFLFPSDLQQFLNHLPNADNAKYDMDQLPKADGEAEDSLKLPLTSSE